MRKASAAAAPSLPSVGKWTSTKLPTLGDDTEAVARRGSASARAAIARCSRRCARRGPDPRRAARTRSDCAGRLTLNGPRMRFTRRSHVPGHRPSRRASAARPRSSRRCAPSHVLGDEASVEPDLVVVAAHVFGVGRVEHERGRRPAGRRAGASPRRTAGRCRSDCSGWRGSTIFVRAVTRASMASTSAVRFGLRGRRRASRPRRGRRCDRRGSRARNRPPRRRGRGSLRRAGAGSRPSLAADDAGGIEAVAPADRRAKGGRGAVRDRGRGLCGLGEGGDALGEAPSGLSLEESL